MGGARASRASWTDSLHLSELSERSERCELCNAPMTRAPQAAPDAAGRRGRGNRGRLLLHPLLGETGKGCRLPGRDPAPGKGKSKKALYKTVCLHDVPERGVAPARRPTFSCLAKRT